MTTVGILSGPAEPAMLKHLVEFPLWARIRAGHGNPGYVITQNNRILLVE